MISSWTKKKEKRRQFRGKDFATIFNDDQLSPGKLGQGKKRGREQGRRRKSNDRMGESFVSTNTGATCSRANRWPRHCKTPDEITSAGLECEIDESITSPSSSSHPSIFSQLFLAKCASTTLPFLKRLSIDSSFLNVARSTKRGCAHFPTTS